MKIETIGILVLGFVCFSCTKVNIVTEDDVSLDVMAKPFSFNGAQYVAFCDPKTDKVISILNATTVQHPTMGQPQTSPQLGTKVNYYVDYDDY